MSANADCAPPSTAVVKRGLSWDGVEFTGTGFPNHFYLGYDFYRHYFPMMALGRYLERQSLEEKVVKSSYTLLEEYCVPRDLIFDTSAQTHSNVGDESQQQAFAGMSISSPVV